MHDRVLGGYVYAYFPCLPSQSFLLRSFLIVIPSLALSPYAVLCTRVYTVVYPRVHCCIHACTQRRSLLLRFGEYVGCANGFSFTLWIGSCLLCEWALLGSPEGLVPARRMDTSQLYGRVRADSIDGFCSLPWRAPLVIVTAPL